VDHTPTDAAVAQAVVATQPEPEDEPLRLEIRDADERDAPWELSVGESEPAEDSGVTPSADWDDEVDDDPSNWAGPV